MNHRRLTRAEFDVLVNREAHAAAEDIVRREHTRFVTVEATLREKLIASQTNLAAAQRLLDRVLIMIIDKREP